MISITSFKKEAPGKARRKITKIIGTMLGDDFHCAEHVRRFDIACFGNRPCGLKRGQSSYVSK